MTANSFLLCGGAPPPGRRALIPLAAVIRDLRYFFPFLGFSTWATLIRFAATALRTIT